MGTNVMELRVRNKIIDNLISCHSEIPINCAVQYTDFFQLLRLEVSSMSVYVLVLSSKSPGGQKKDLCFEPSISFGPRLNFLRL